MELSEGRSIPLRKLRHTVQDFLLNGPRVPKPLPTPSVVDLTPISDETIAYWAEQGYLLSDVQDDPAYQAEILQANAEQIEKRKRSEPFDPNQFGPKDPSHPYAYTPRYVTFAMRRNQDFRCHVMGWLETDWVFNKLSGGNPSGRQVDPRPHQGCGSRRRDLSRQLEDGCRARQS